MSASTEGLCISDDSMKAIFP